MIAILSFWQSSSILTEGLPGLDDVETVLTLDVE